MKWSNISVKTLRDVFSSKNNDMNLQDVRRLLTSTKSTRELAKTMRWEEMPNSLSIAPLLDALEFQEMIFATKSTNSNNVVKKNVPPIPPPTTTASSSHDALVALQKRNNELRRTNAELLKELSSAPTLENMNRRNKKLEDELRNEIETLRETHRTDLRRERERVESSAENLRDQIDALTKENQELMQTRVSPDALRFQALERRLIDMESSYRERESQLELVLSAARRDGRMNIAETKRHYEAELKRKDAEIEKFRNELNDMMRVLKSLKRRRRRRG